MDAGSVQQLWRMLDQVIHPRQHGVEWFFSRLNVIIILVIFGIPLALSTPYLSDWSGCRVADLIRAMLSLEHAKQMCDWFVVLFLVAIFGAIGGIAFTQKLATDLERTATRLRDDMIAAQHHLDEEAAAAREAKLLELYRLLQEPGYYIRKVSEALRLMRAAMGELNYAPYRSGSQRKA
jgi:hypothetical protein